MLSQHTNCSSFHGLNLFHDATMLGKELLARIQTIFNCFLPSKRITSDQSADEMSSYVIEDISLVESKFLAFFIEK